MEENAPLVKEFKIVDRNLNSWIGMLVCDVYKAKCHEYGRMNNLGLFLGRKKFEKAVKRVLRANKSLRELESLADNYPEILISYRGNDVIMAGEYLERFRILLRNRYWGGGRFAKLIDGILENNLELGDEFDSILSYRGRDNHVHSPWRE